MKLAALTFVRPGELRPCRMVLKIDLKAKEWRIPAEKMKMKARPILSPLSRQSIKVFEEVEMITGHGKYVFSFRTFRCTPYEQQYG